MPPDPVMPAELRASQLNKYRALWEFAHGITDVRSIPANLQMARSNLCNFKCVYCIDHREGNDIPRTRIEGDIWARLQQLIPRAESLAFHGISEFMIDPGFFEIVGNCGTARAALSINTNGSVCTPRHVEALATYPGHLSMNFSLDAATPRTFLRIRGWDFVRVIRNIRTYVRRFSERRDSLWLSVSFVITKSNVHEMTRFVYLAKGLGMDAVKYYRLHEYDRLDWQVTPKAGGVFDYRSECTRHFAEEYDGQIERTRIAAEQVRIAIELPAPLSEAERGEHA